MAGDATLPPARLAHDVASGEIVRHFWAAFGLRVHVDYDIPEPERLTLARTRVLEPPEARLLDHVLQVVPGNLLSAVDRIVMLDAELFGRLGTDRRGIIRIGGPDLNLGLGDPDYNGRFSLFATTVLHEIGRAVYDRQLTIAQRSAVDDLYLAAFLQSKMPPEPEPTARGVEHYFVRVPGWSRGRSTTSIVRPSSLEFRHFP